MKSYILMSLVILLVGSNSWAQAESDLGHYHQVGAYIGRVLPNGIDGADEIFQQWGMRYSMPAGKKSGSTYYDFSTFLANSMGVNWQGASLGMSMQAPVETLVGHAGIGVDVVRYETETTASKTEAGGLHFIGGVMSRVGGNILARFDMKLNTKPGTSLFFGVGLVMELDDLGGSGAGTE